MNDAPGQSDSPTRRKVIQTGAIGTGLVALGGGAIYLTRQLAAGGPSDDSAIPSKWEYDLSELQKVDPVLIRYQSIPAPTRSPSFDLASIKVTGLDDRAAQRLFITGSARQGDWLFLADSGNRCIWRCEGDGKMVDRIGAEKHFIVPSPYFDVAADPDGQTIWVTNPGKHRVEHYTLKGERIDWFGKPGSAIEKFCGCCNPCGIAVLSDGRIVTAEKGLPRVKVYHRDGRLESVVAGPEAFREQAETCAMGDCTQGGMDVQTDPQDRIWVRDRVTKRIHCFQRKDSPGRTAENHG